MYYKKIKVLLKIAPFSPDWLIFRLGVYVEYLQTVK
nr:MAG TPA: hypothetical protein [Caudoviricetes sp.]